MNSPIRFTGLTSGMDTQGMVQQIMRAENMRMDRLTRRRQVLQWRQSDLRSTISTISDFRAQHTGNRATAINNVDSWNTMRAEATRVSGSETGGISVTASGNAPVGNTRVEVYQRAQGALVSGSTLFRGRATNTADAPVVDLNAPVLALPHLPGQAGVHNPDGRITINGVDILLTGPGSLTMQGVMNRINASDAGVTMAFNELHGRFTLTSNSVGADAQIVVSGNRMGAQILDSIGLNHIDTRTATGVAPNIPNPAFPPPRQPNPNAPLVPDPDATMQNPNAPHILMTAEQRGALGSDVSLNLGQLLRETIGAMPIGTPDAEVVDRANELIAQVNAMFSMSIPQVAAGTTRDEIIAADGVFGIDNINIVQINPISIPDDIESIFDGNVMFHLEQAGLTIQDPSDTIPDPDALIHDPRFDLPNEHLRLIADRDDTPVSVNLRRILLDALEFYGNANSPGWVTTGNLGWDEMIDELNAFIYLVRPAFGQEALNHYSQPIDLYNAINELTNAREVFQVASNRINESTINSVITLDIIDRNIPSITEYDPEYVQEFIPNPNDTPEMRERMQRAGQDAIIYIHDDTGRAQLSQGPDDLEPPNRNPNVFEVNGLRIDITNAEVGQVFDVTVTRSVDDAIDMVRDFIEAYNDLIRYLNALHSTPRPRAGNSVRGAFFEPLTDEQRQAMSDREIERWEEQARIGLLHRDRDLRNIHSQLREFMFRPVILDGEGNTISLHEIGITTVGMNGADSDRLIGVLEIDFDILRAELEGNPERVQQLFARSPHEAGRILGADARERNANAPYVGLGWRLDEFMNTLTADSRGPLRQRAGAPGGGGIDSSTNQMTRQIQDYNRRIDQMQQFLIRREAHFFAMFARMEQAMAQSHAQMDSLFAFMMQ